MSHDQRIGYLVSGDSLLWTKRGLLKARELNSSDEVMGLDREIGEVSFEALDSPRKVGEDVFRVTTNANEVLLPPQSHVYTIMGRKAVSNLREGDKLDVFYRPKTMKQLRNLYSNNQEQYIFVNHKKIALSEELSYLLGTQALLSYKRAFKLVVQLQSGQNYRKVCQLLKQAMIQTDLPHRVLYRPTDFRKIVIEDNTQKGVFAETIFVLFRSGSVPLGIRKSKTQIFKRFLEGILDSSARVSKGGLLKFYIPADHGVIRRFIISTLVLFDIQPRYTFVIKYPGMQRIMYIYLALHKKRFFDIKSLGDTTKEHLAEKTHGDVKIYSSVQCVARFRKETAYLIPSSREHWDIIADLTPIHVQKV